MVDELGRPLVVYHGTSKDFTEFRPSKDGANGPGIYFTTYKSLAESHGKKIIEAYARIHNEKDGAIAGHEVIVKSPANIKLVTGNAGTFNPESKDIRFSNNSRSGLLNSGSTVKQVRAWLPRGVRPLFDVGKIKIVQSANDLPLRLRSPDAALYHTAWHGSPFDHDVFSAAMIGAGENASGFGYGHYFTGSKSDARYYRDKLEHKKGTGKIYRVEIPDPALMLDFNLPLDEQSNFVQKALARLPRDCKIESNWDGRTIFEAIKENVPAFSDQEAEYRASRLLADLGIKGSTHNDFEHRHYVVFADDDIQIVAKYCQFDARKLSTTPRKMKSI